MIAGHLEIITEDRYSDAFSIMEKHFPQEEPLSSAFGVSWSKSEPLFLPVLTKHLSVMTVSDVTNEVTGILINSVLKKTDFNETVDVDIDPLRASYEFVAHKDKEIDLFNRFGLCEVFLCYALAVHLNYRRQGLGTALVGSSWALAKELGFRAVKADCSSNFSQKIFGKFGAQLICVLPYDQYKYKDKYINKSAGVHICTKILLAKVDDILV